MKRQNKGVEKAIDRSKKAIGVFYNVVDELQNANAELAEARSQHEEEISYHENKIIETNTQEAQNDRIIEKFNGIIGG